MFWAKQLNDSSEWNKFATALLYSLNIDYGKNLTVVSHIPQFGDATTSSAADVRVASRDVRDRDQKKNFTGTRTGTEKKLPGPRPGPGPTLESETI
jgi:hypothetical protein